MEKVFFLG